MRIHFGRTALTRTALALTLVAAGAIEASRVGAQAPPASSARVAEILAQFPAGSRMQRDALADQMLSLGESGIAEFTRRLVPMGAGDDANVRFALNGMAVYASEFGADSKRAIAERAFVQALGAESNAEVRTFLLRQLRIVGRDLSVQAAAKDLTDPALVEPAVQLMLAVKSAAAGSALLAALDTATGPARITIAKALGELNVAAANDRLLMLAKDADPALRKVSLAALARIASPASYATLAAAAERAAFRWDPTDANAAFLDYAARSADRADTVTAEKVCRAIMSKTTRPDQLATRAAALSILVTVRGADALPDLLTAMDQPDRAYRNAALRSAESVRGVAVIRQWTAKAAKVDAERRAEIVAMLGRQGDRLALPFIRASLTFPDPAVMLASAEALAHIEGPNATPELLSLLKSIPGSSAPKLGDILRGTLDERHLDPIAGMLDSLPPASKAVAVSLIGAKGGKRFAGRILALTSDGTAEIRTAAIGALAGVANASDLPALVRLLDGASDDSVPAIQKAVVAAAVQIASDGSRATPIAQAIPASPHPDRLIDLLPQIGGSRALSTAVELFGLSSEDLQAAAFRALNRWPGTEAAPRLLAIVAAGDATYRNQAYSAYVRQVSAASVPAEQKVLQLRKVLPFVSTTGDRRILIRALQSLRTFQSFLLVSAMLDDAGAAADAAAATMRLALPTSADAHDGMTGSMVRRALEKAKPLISGSQREADKASIQKYLDSMPTDDGFVSIFNGTDLTGWKGLVGNPITRAKMSPEELAAKQKDADAKAFTNWTVRDGTIVFNGSGDNLCTVKDYGDFEMVVDWRITKDGDSGIYLRGSPQVQIWDPARVDVGAEVGSGGLYNNQKNPSKPLVFADNPVGEWNTFRIVMIGDRVSVFLNGVKTVDNVTLENYWDRKLPIFARDAIELQAHGTDLAFRDLYVRDLTGAEYGLTEEERADGFRSLFNGRDLDGWVGNQTGYAVKDAVIAYDPKAGDHSNLYTAREYGDFQFRFDFQLTAGANSGVGIRAPRDGDAAYVGMEIQVLDDTASIYAALQPYQYHGSVYGVIPAKRGALKPVGEWNTEEIFVRGSHIRVTVNGVITVDGDLVEASRNGTIDHREHPGLRRLSGAIGWLSHDSVVRFRNVRIKELWPAGRTGG